MSLILVATVGGVLLERFSSVACRTDAWGYAGAEPGTRPATVRGPPTAVFRRPSCQITAGQFMARLTTGQGLLHHIERGYPTWPASRGTGSGCCPPWAPSLTSPGSTADRGGRT